MYAASPAAALPSEFNADDARRCIDGECSHGAVSPCVGTYRDAPRQNEAATEIRCSNFADALTIVSV